MKDLSEDTKVKVLNVGCGSNKIKGAINMDKSRNVNPDMIFDLEWCGNGSSISHMPLADNSIEKIYAFHVLEHIHNILPAMEELHRVAAPGALMMVRVPYGQCSIAFEDPTHVRQMFPKSFMYFGQMAYNAADYGYRGDWDIVEMIVVARDEFREMPMDELGFMIERAFNVADELMVVLKAVKPIRAADAKPQAIQMKIGFAEEINQQMRNEYAEMQKERVDEPVN